MSLSYSTFGWRVADKCLRLKTLHSNNNLAQSLEPLQILIKENAEANTNTVNFNLRSDWLCTYTHTKGMSKC